MVLRAPKSSTVTLLSGLLLGISCGGRSGGETDRSADLRTAPPAPHFRPAPPLRTLTIGRSVHGRPIRAVVLGDPRSPHPVLVFGCIDGNEPAGIAIARWLIARHPATRSTLWIVPDLNPDGVVAGTRVNSRGVDLNRNFPYRWAPLWRPGDPQYQGSRPLSEPESRAAYALILHIRPRITIWFHQPLGLTDLSGGDPRIERRFAALVGLPVQQLVRYPGSAAGWQNHTIHGSTAFVVELPPGSLTPAATARYARAIEALAR